jgi:ABC-type nitrate/sulfonate/bicarbonate transport system substrate-binding protein
MLNRRLSDALNRRRFLTLSALSAGALLAACGQSAASPSSAPAGAAVSEKPATSAPATSPSSASSAKPVASAGAASAKPAGSGSSAASAKPAASPAASAKPGAAAGGATSLKASMVGVGANQMLWPLALDGGYFDKYGLKADVASIQGAEVAASALLKGEVDMLTTGGQFVVAAIAAKQEMVMIAGLQNEVVSTVLGGPGVNTIEDTRGKTIAVTKIGQAGYFDWVSLAAKKGWKLEDFKFVNANNQPGQVQMLSSGNAQATSISPPFEVSAVHAGAHVIEDLSQEHIALQLIGIVVTRSWLAQNRPKALSAVKATIEAVNRWKTDATFTKGVIKKWLKEDDQEVVDSAYSHFVDVWPKAPYPTKEGMAAQVSQVGSVTPDVKGVNPDECIDSSVVKELEDSGFIKQVFGS